MNLVLFPSSSSQRRLLFLACAVGGFLILFWAQVLPTPFWQDDYYFLLEAQQSRLAGEPWFAAFFPETQVHWWRPLGERTYWRFVEGVLGGSAPAAHVCNLLLLVAAAASVGWFVAAFIALREPEQDPAPAGLFAALLYGLHASHFLPAAWASAANASLAVLFSALTLRFWLTVATAGGARALRAAPLTLLCFLLALLSRDIAFVLPALALLLVLWLRPRCRLSPVAWGTGALCLGIAFAWLLLRQHFMLPSDAAYEFRFGLNLVRNAVALALFVFNVPFEALRFFFFVRPSFASAAWGLSCFALQAWAFVLLLRGAREYLGGKDFLMFGVFFVLGCAPAFPLSVNCYPYYTAFGLFGYAIIAGFAALRGRMLPQILLLAAISAAGATLGNFFLDSPSHIGRARWAERQLVRLEAMREVRPELFAPPLVVVVEDEHRFLGFRREGIAWRLGIDPALIEVREPQETAAAPGPVLVVPREGDVHFRAAGEVR